MFKKSIGKVSRILKDIESINDQDLELFIREKIESWLSRLDDCEDLTFVNITGSTPAFNDGEPCEHSDRVEFSNRFSVFGDYTDYTQYSVSHCDEEIVSINKIFLLLYKTNYQIKIKIDPDTKTVTNINLNKKYDCGY